MTGVRKEITVPVPDWTDAACVGKSPHLFFPPSTRHSTNSLTRADIERETKDAAEAKAICRRCSIRVECLTYATTAPENFGIWGGTTERDRRDMRTTRRALEPARHGTRRRYSAGCKCRDCRAANAAYKREIAS